MKNTINNCWCPQVVPKDVHRLISNLNSILKGPYFIANVVPTKNSFNYYRLSYTPWAYENNKDYEQLCTDETTRFRLNEFKAYLLGLTIGLSFNRS